MAGENTDLLQTAKVEIIRVQIERFHEFYASYFQREETRPMVEYFFDRIYSLENNQEWRKLALGTFQNVKSLVKEETRNNIEHLIELNELTESLDLLLARKLLEKGYQPGTTISLSEYRNLYVEAGQGVQRQRHLDLVIGNMLSFYDLAHRPVNAILIKPARFMSKMLGIYPLFATVEEGYYAVLPVSRELFESFLSEVKTREREYLSTAFGEPQP
ncbi:MAG: hypothetical protein JNM27_06120 [Leptospirales bacterium]|nr:hypothetical protein [Leptospirales bacterium]